MQITMITLQETEITDPVVTQDLEQCSLPLHGPAIKSTHVLFTPEEAEDNDLEVNNIMNIIGLCLKNTKRGNTKYVIKLLSQLITVSEYVKLCACYWKTKACKWPCLSASIAIACQIGKGPYFAYQI
jgi:hypothetical protein